jgi:putative ABC transport system substrate-binding protein
MAVSSKMAREKSIPLILALICLLPAIFLPSASTGAQQPGKVYRIGYLSGGVSGPSPDIEAFRQGLRDLGYFEGKNLVIEYRYTERNAERYPKLAADLVRLNVDVIIGDGTSPTIAVKKATSTIPIVMTSATDPVANGLIASLARPGGNVTGLSNVGGELGGKILELLKEMLPRFSRVAVVIPAGPAPANKIFLKETEASARGLRVRVMSLVTHGPEDYEGVVGSAMKERANALISRLPPATPPAHRTQFTAVAAKKRLPVASTTDLDTENGALISYGSDTTDRYRRAAIYVDKILKGAKPADLPVEQPTKLQLVINLKTAKQIGLTIPPNVLARADRVIK